jgi:hypothetical protein
MASPEMRAMRWLATIDERRMRRLVVRERIPRSERFGPWSSEPKDLNIQQPTSNIEHPMAAL